MSKNQRESARKAAEKFAAQSKRDNRTRNILIGVIGVVILALVGVGYMLVKESQKTLLTEFDGVAPAVATLNGAIPFGGSGAVAGVKNEGAPELGVYADFLCPACGAFEQANGAEIRDLVESGDVTLMYHPVNILDGSGNGTGYSTRAANAFLEVVEAQPELALEFMELLFANQPGGEGLTDEQMGQIAATIGVKEEVSAKFSEGNFNAWVQAARAQASRDGMRHTPSVALNGKITDINWQAPGAITEFVGK